MDPWIHESAAGAATGASASVATIYMKAGGKPSTWFPPGGLVEQDISNLENSQQTSARKCL